MDTYILIAQAMGLIGMSVDLYATTHKDDQRLKLLISVAGTVFAVHFAMLGAWTAAISEVLTVARCLACLRWRSVKVSAPFMAAYAIAAIFTARNLIDFFPYIASINGTYAMFHTSGFKMRVLFIVGQLLWLVYSAVHHSIGGTLLYTLLVLSTARTGWALFKDPKAPIIH